MKSWRQSSLRRLQYAFFFGLPSVILTLFVPDGVLGTGTFSWRPWRSDSAENGSWTRAMLVPSSYFPGSRRVETRPLIVQRGLPCPLEPTSANHFNPCAPTTKMGETVAASPLLFFSGIANFTFSKAISSGERDQRGTPTARCLRHRGRDKKHLRNRAVHLLHLLII